MFEYQKITLDALVDISKTEPQRVINIRYSDLMADAMASIRSIYDGLQVEAPGDLEARVQGFLKKQRSGKRAVPPKALETFGYTSDMVWNEPNVAAYYNFFVIEKETSRMLDTSTKT